MNQTCSTEHDLLKSIEIILEIFEPSERAIVILFTRRVFIFSKHSEAIKVKFSENLPSVDVSSKNLLLKIFVFKRIIMSLYNR